jgi:hypothetical protein
MGALVADKQKAAARRQQECARKEEIGKQVEVLEGKKRRAEEEEAAYFRAEQAAIQAAEERVRAPTAGRSGGGWKRKWPVPSGATASAESSSVAGSTGALQMRTAVVCGMCGSGSAWWGARGSG